MDENTFAGSASPPTMLARAFDSGSQDHIYTAVFQYASDKLARVGRGYAEGHIEAQDLAQHIAIKILHKLAEGGFSGTGFAFASWVDKILWNARKDFYRAANRRRDTDVPFFVTRENESGDEEEFDYRDVIRAAERMPCARLLPADTSGFDPAVLQVFCDDVNGVRYSRQRARPSLSATDEAIVEAMLDEDKPTYADVAAKVGMSAKQVENRLNTIRRRERKKREQALAATTTTKIIPPVAGIDLPQTFI